MHIEKFLEGKLSPEGTPVIVLESLEDFPTVFPELLSALEQRLAGAESIEAAQQRLVEDPLSHIGQRLGDDAARIVTSFSVGVDLQAEDAVCGTIAITYFPNDEYPLPPLSSPVELAHDVALRFTWKQKVPMHSHGNGWKLHTSHSQFGSLFGDTDLGSWDKDWVTFESHRAQEIYRAQGLEPGWKPTEWEKTIDVSVPYAMRLILGVNWNGRNYRELGNGEASLDANYGGIVLRAADLNWGDGEFVALVRHLGLGRGEKPKYTFERYDSPQR